MKRHQKSISSPKSWKFERKLHKFVTRPFPGQHSYKTSAPLSLFLREHIKAVRTKREIRKILNDKSVAINNKVVTTEKFPIGLFDLISVGKNNYFVLYNKYGKLIVKELKQNLTQKPYKIVKKTILKGGKIQLTLYNGNNLLTDNKSYKVGDTLIIDNNGKIKSHIALANGAYAYITGGKSISAFGRLKEIKTAITGLGDIAVIEHDGKQFSTLKKYVFIIGTEKPMVPVE